MKELTITITGTFEDPAEHEDAGRMLHLVAHEARYQIEKRHPGNKIDLKVEGYVLESV